MMNIPIIDPEFSALIPPLSEDELAQLEINILRDGCRDPLTVWRGLLLDGHNRLSICLKHGLAFDVVEIELDSRNAAKLWIIDNQFGRRNMSKIDAIDLAMKREPIIAEMARANLVTSTGGANPQPLPKLAKAAINTREESAKLAGVSHGTYGAGKLVLEAVASGKIPRDTLDKIRVGKESISGIAKAIADYERATAEKDDAEDDDKDLGDGCFNCAFSQSVRHGSGSLFCTATGYVLEDVLSTPCEMKLWKHEQADEEPTDDKQESAVAEEEPETRPDYHHVSDDSYEWYTPADHIEAARELMGGIDLDPASCEEAQANVKAGVYYTKETDGLAQDWFGRVWMNPPYCMPEIDRFTGRIIEEYKAGKVDQAVVLTNNSTDTAWFHRLLEQSDLVCLTRGRVKFWGPDGSAATGARQGQAIFYLGDNTDGFRQHFGKFGAIVKTYDD